MESRLDENKMIQIITLYDEDDNEIELEIPFTWAVCGHCNGKGKHVNPSVDGHGITQEEWDRDWSPEEQEGYFAGHYDVQCEECHGRRVVPEIDEEKYEKEHPDLYKMYLDRMEQEAIWRRQEADERKYGY